MFKVCPILNFLRQIFNIPAAYVCILLPFTTCACMCSEKYSLIKDVKYLEVLKKSCRLTHKTFMHIS